MTVGRVNSPANYTIKRPPTPQPHPFKMISLAFSPPPHTLPFSPASKHDTTRERWKASGAIRGAKFSEASVAAAAAIVAVAAAELFHTLIL